MTQNPNDTPTDASTDDSHLDRPERNRYFHGKLMTARDMQAEQRYHRGQRRAHSRHVTGEGVVCGLDVDVEGTDDGGLVIAVDPGFALDCYGRSVVVPNRTTKELGPTEAPAGDRISLYLDYSECVKESVPIPGSEKSCEEECAYNRVLEVFEIRYVDGGPEDGTVKSVPDVDFPTRKEVADDEGESTQGPTNSELATIARSFTMDGDDAAACVTGDPTVFLGVFDHAGGNTWEWVHDVPRSRVYTNDMLYAATARHTADFLNPHQVSLSAKTVPGSSEGEDDAVLHVEDDENPDADVTVTSSDDTVAVDADADAKQLDLTEGQSITDLKEKTDDHIADQENPHQVSLAAKSAPGSVEGAALHVEDDESADADVTVTSSDRTVAVDADADAKRVDLTAGEALLEIIEDRLAPMEQYVMDKTLKYKLRTFSRVADVFGSEAASRVAERTRDAILERAYADRDEYFSFVEGVHVLERRVIDEVEGNATDETLERYGRALERLGEAIDGAGEAGVLRVAVAQDEVCEAAEWLEARNEDLRQSLEEKRDAYASVAERFESEAAWMVVERTEDAIADGVHTDDEAYRRFIEDVVELEDEVAGELEGTVTRASYDRYVSELEELFTALGADDVRDVMTAQNGVSRAATRFERDEGLDEERYDSLRRKHETFADVAGRFESAAAREVAGMTAEAIEARVFEDEEEYVRFVEEVAGLEREVADEIDGTATPSSHEQYVGQLDDLVAALEGGSGPDVMAAQNGVSDAAARLERDTTEPNEELRASLLGTREAFADVADRFESEVAREVVAITEDGIGAEVYANGEEYIGFVEEFAHVERELPGEIDGIATGSSLERYDVAVGRLFETLESGAPAREVATAQSRVSEAAVGLERSADVPFDELQNSLMTTRTAFGDVAQRFESEVAREVVAMTEDAIGAEVYADGQEYVRFVAQLSGVERELTGELQDRATGASLEGYAAAVNELAAAIERRADPGEIATAQNRVSGSARQLERRERRRRRRRTLDQELQYSLQHVREAFVMVAERFESEVAREVVAMTEDAIEGGVAADDAEYVGFVEELFGVERELTRELDGTATPTSLERYDAAVTRLAATLEEAGSAYDVAAAQNTVSEVTARLEQGEELPREQLHGSLQYQRDAFAGVAERFESEVAREVVAMVEDATGAGVYADEADYRAYIEDVIPVERNLLEELGGVATQSSLERYAMAVDRLAAMVERGSNVGEVAAAQNGVSEAAAGLEPDDGVSLDEDLRASLDGTREAFAGVADRFDSEVARQVVAMAEDAIGAEAYADGARYVGFVEELFGVERELLGELEGVATQASLEEYHGATGELASALETGEPQRVAVAQDEASTAATRLARIEEPTNEKFQTSLTNARTAFAGVADRFNSEVAGRVVGMVENGIRSKVYSDADAYLRFVEALFPVERRLLEELQQVGVRDGLENYYRAIEALNSALQDGDPHQVVAVQNGVSEAAAGLGGTDLRWPDRTVDRTGDTTFDWTGDTTGDTTSDTTSDTTRDPTFDPTFDTILDPTVERVFDPTEYTVAELEQELATVSDPELLESILAAEIDGQDRTTAKDAIRTRLAKVSR